MAFDGIVIKRICEELQNLIGYKVDKVLHPDKNTIILGLYKAGNNINILSCISSNSYRIHITNHQYSNPITAPNYCMLLRKHLIGFKIKNIYTQNLERIIFIDFENSDNLQKTTSKKLIVELMGKHSNIILTNENNIIIDSMRHSSTEENAQRDIYPTCQYILPKTSKYNILEIKDSEEFYTKLEPLIINHLKDNIEDITNLNIKNFNLDKLISDNFNGISKSFIENIISDTDNISINNLKEFYNIIMNYISVSTNSLVFKPIYDKNNIQKDYTLSISNHIDDTTTYNNIYKLNLYLDNFYYNKDTLYKFNNYKNRLLNIVLSTLKKYKKRLDNINKKLVECEGMDKFKIYGELIIANLYKITDKNISEVTLENYYDNNNLITIPLDKKYLPSYNAKQYFKKYSKLKNALNIVNIQKQETMKEINYIESVLFEIENCNSYSDMETLNIINEEINDSNIFNNNISSQKNKLNNKKHKINQSKNISFNPISYTIENYKIYVGKNNKENDYLTTKFSNKNDIWFHTKDIHGAHVILKTHPNEIVPDNILFEAAKIAALHSQAKNSSKIPVDYCAVAFVKKPNNSKPGFVIYKNNKTIII